jgi:2-(1,2-epoxy-1,2-dihydrophenyl)acetyl-CoA isomerase
MLRAMSTTVLYEQRDGVATITLNRPERLNAMGDDMLVRVLERLESAAHDDSVRVVVLTGQGRGFCAGGDLGALSERGKALAEGRDKQDRETKIALLRRSMRSSQLLHEMDKVTIAAINGACAGAGLAWACACDVRYAAQSAKFNVAFRNAGLSGDFGGTWTLPRIVGAAKARELYLLSPRFDAEEAARIGLVSKVLPDAELMAHATKVAHELASAAPVALKLMKRNLNDSDHHSFDQHLDREAERHVLAAETEDHLEATSAYLQKRVPQFKGR